MRVYLVHPTGIEPISLVPETNVLSVELRVPRVYYITLWKNLKQRRFAGVEKPGDMW